MEKNDDILIKELKEKGYKNCKYVINEKEYNF